MSLDISIYLLDGDSRRRAAISHSLAQAGIHVEPLERVEELVARWPRAGMILAHDEPAALPALMAQMGASTDWLPVIAYAEDATPAKVVQAVLEGAIAYLAWPFAPGELATTIGQAQERARRVGNTKVREAMARSRIQRLTQREREVLRGVAGGLSNRLIGEQLAISPRTVEIHRANMLNKMGASHTSEAIRIAIEAAILN